MPGPVLANRVTPSWTFAKHPPLERAFVTGEELVLRAIEGKLRTLVANATTANRAAFIAVLAGVTGLCRDALRIRRGIAGQRQGQASPCEQRPNCLMPESFTHCSSDYALQLDILHQATSLGLPIYKRDLGAEGGVGRHACHLRILM